jgi:hypothetical protein
VVLVVQEVVGAVLTLAVTPLTLVVLILVVVVVEDIIVLIALQRVVQELSYLDTQMFTLFLFQA